MKHSAYPDAKEICGSWTPIIRKAREEGATKVDIALMKKFQSFWKRYF